jgi:peptidoglycan-N-acetylglucosamine deacetylase
MTGLDIGAALAAPAAGGAGLLYYACSWPTSQLLGPGLVRGPASAGPKVALTFDDGPSEPYTGQILDILHRHRAPATFFCCGKNVQRLPAVARRIADAGHTIGNHTYSHPLLYFKRRSVIEDELDRAQDVIDQAIGKRPGVFRPPYGVRWFGLFPVLRERGLADVQWSDTGYDWVAGNSPADIARKTMTRLGAGSIILLHDGREPRDVGQIDASATVAALPGILEGARSAGLEFVPIEQFLPSLSS